MYRLSRGLRSEWEKISFGTPLLREIREDEQSDDSENFN
jgi:hypothetical protein